jgi:hypothetical protein
MAPSRTLAATGTPDVTPSTRRWIAVAARFGYLAKASVYGVIGIMALLAALHTGQSASGSRGAFMAILSRPFGRLLLGILCAGLAAYALWRFTQAFLDSDHRGSDAPALFARFGMAGTALIYAGLSYSALRIFLGLRAPASDDERARSWTAWLLAQPYGPWLVAAAGAAIVGLALHEAYVVYRANFAGKLKTEEMNDSMRKLIFRCARIGHGARAAVFGVIGVFLISAAVHTDAREARGLGGALFTLEQQPYGDWLLAAVASGFLAYALYLLMLVFYRRILEW